MNDLERYRTDCGYASVRDILEGELDPRMESFLLSETFKYLYLLFDVGKFYTSFHANR